MARALRFGHRIGLLVALAAAGLIAVTSVTLVLGRGTGRQIAGIETRYVPLLEVDRDLEATLAQLVRALEDAASAADERRLQDADALRDAFVARLHAGRDAIADNGGDPDALEAELRAYYATARAVSSAIAQGRSPAELTTQIETMRAQQQAFAARLQAATSPDRRRLAAAFESVRASHDASLWIDIAVATGVLAIMAIFSWQMIRRTVRSLAAVSVGVAELARGELDHEITVDDRAEIGDLAREANRTAAQLRDYRARIERDDWIKTGAAELGDAIVGELDADALGAKVTGFLARHVGATAATLHRGAGDPPAPAGAHVLVERFAYDGEDLGAIALGFAAPPEERVGAFVTRIAGVVGAAFRVAEQHARVQGLLVETRAQKDAADAANRELEAFSYSVSHDLRSPLRAIDGFSQAVLERNAAQLDDKGQDYLRRVRAAAQRMGELIDALLQLAHINRIAIARTRVDVSELARGLADELARRDPARSVTVAIADGLDALADGRMVRAVLDNLLGNAWKFTARTDGARIEVGRDDAGAFFVRDNGAGFDMAYAAKLFAPFQRLHSDREFAGTGIGLATVRRIVDRHGGRVWAEGEVGRGATVFFTFAPEGATHEP